jgi:hypothetical protein
MSHASTGSAVLVGKWINACTRPSARSAKRASAASRSSALTARRTALRSPVTMSDGGLTQIAHHEFSADGVSWTASMDVTLRKVT